MRIDYGQLEFLHPTLREILHDLEIATGVEFTTTSIFRIGDSGVHGQLPVRGYDLRCRMEDMGRVLESYINRTWCYDPERLQKMCCLLHGEGSNLHLHVQVSDSTVRN